MKIVYDDSVEYIESDEFPAPSPAIMPGESLLVLVPFKTLRGEFYSPGDRLRIVSRTTEAPHNRYTVQDRIRGNWNVGGKDGAVTVWSNIEIALHEGQLGRE